MKSVLRTSIKSVLATEMVGIADDKYIANKYKLLFSSVGTNEELKFY